MKRAVAVVLVFVAGLLPVACGGASTPTTVIPTPPSSEALKEGGYVYPGIPRITAEELRVRLDEKQPMIVIDNRNAYKFNAGHLAGAFSITDAIDSPYSGAEEEMDQKLAALPDDVLKVFYCD